MLEDDIKFIQEVCYELDYEMYHYGKDWHEDNKYKGNVISRLIAFILRKHLKYCTVSEVNAHIREYPTEFDILILDKDATPAYSFDSNVWKYKDVRAVIEVKKTGVWYNDTDFERKFSPFINLGKPFFYITVRESRRQTVPTKRVLGDRSFILGATGRDRLNNSEWKRFLFSIDKELGHHTLR